MISLPVLVVALVAALLLVIRTEGAYSYPGRQSTPGYARSESSYLPALPGQRPSCAGPADTFCDQTDYYPREIIETLVKQYSYDLETLLQNDTADSWNMTDDYNVLTSLSEYSEGDVYIPSSDQQSDNYPALQTGNDRQSQEWWNKSRNGPERRRQVVSASYRVTRQVPSDETLCPTSASFISPKVAVNTKGNWVYVVNLDPGTTQQLVRTERCRTSRCSGLCTIPVGYSSTCSQQYVQKRLVALSGEGDRLYSDTFWFPHCCICQIKPNT